MFDHCNLKSLRLIHIMPTDLIHRIGIAAPAQMIYRALTPSKASAPNGKARHLCKRMTHRSSVNPTAIEHSAADAVQLPND